MKKFKFKYQMYRYLYEKIPEIMIDMKNATDEIGIPDSLKGKLGLSGTSSGCPGILIDEVAKAMSEGAKKIISNKFLDDQIREIVKDYYGDEYDAVAVNTCDAALRIILECIVTPPRISLGDNYRARFITPLERHVLYVAAFGTPYPPRYKDLLTDKSLISGEHGLTGKQLNNLDAIIVPLEGARYEVHGIRYFPASLLVGVQAVKSAKKIGEMAKIHSDYLSAIVSLGYDSPGYGYGEKDENGVPLLQKELAKLSKSLGIPYIIDDANGAPFVGTDIRKIGADIICYSMDKISRAPTSGLIIGREELMVPIRRAVGVHGERSGSPLSHGVAAFCMHDPGRQALIGLIAAMKVLKEEPQRIIKATDKLYEIVCEEIMPIISKFKDSIIISKSYNSGFVEINYQSTWKNENMGIPIFTAEDSFCGTDLISAGIGKMGIIPGISYDANIIISTGIGTIDGMGNLLPDETRIAIKSLVKAIEIINRYVDYDAK